MVHSIEYGGSTFWIAYWEAIYLCNHRSLCRNHSSCETPLFIVGDFNETLHQCESNSGYLNGIGSTDFKRFISNCNLLEYPLSGHRYTRFHGNSMSRTDRAFATPYFHLTFSGLLLNRFPQELSDHCPMILGLQCQTWRWKPFRFLNC